jgi:hypothetical protein
MSGHVVVYKGAEESVPVAIEEVEMEEVTFRCALSFEFSIYTLEPPDDDFLSL